MARSCKRTTWMNNPQRSTAPNHNFMHAPVMHITDSQNGRGWKRTLEIIESNPLIKQAHTQQAAQDHVQAGPGRRLPNLSGQPAPRKLMQHSLIFSHRCKQVG